MPDAIDVVVAYVEPTAGGWTLSLEGERQSYVTASGAIYHGIRQGRTIARAGREVWVLWRNGEAWSVAWTSEEQSASREGRL